MRILILLFLVVSISSCFLFKEYRKKEFAFTQGGQPQRLSILVPKGYVKEERRDTAGIQLHTFQYPGGGLLYAACLADTTYELQSFNKAIHHPLAFGSDGLVYKGQDSGDLYYREIRRGNLRFGYRNVPLINEVNFDSATNYAAMQPH